MSKAESKHIAVEPGDEEIVLIEGEPDSIVEATIGPLSSAARLDQDAITAHLQLTAPDRFMEGFELQDSYCALYLGLDPKNTPQAMMATLAITAFNISSTCLADGSGRNISPQERDINIKLGLKATGVAADLIEKFQAMRHGSQKSFKVGRVNVEAGGQAIVGNIQSTRQRLDQLNGATKPFRPQKEEPRG